MRDTITLTYLWASYLLGIFTFYFHIIITNNFPTRSIFSVHTPLWQYPCSCTHCMTSIRPYIVALYQKNWSCSVPVPLSSKYFFAQETQELTLSLVVIFLKCCLSSLALRNMILLQANGPYRKFPILPSSARDIPITPSGSLLIVVLIVVWPYALSWEGSLDPFQKSEQSLCWCKTFVSGSEEVGHVPRLLLRIWSNPRTTNDSETTLPLIDRRPSTLKCGRFCCLRYRSNFIDEDWRRWIE